MTALQCDIAAAFFAGFSITAFILILTGILT